MNASAFAPQTPDLVGSYDNDLKWILEKLVDRTGGSAGSIVRHLANEEAPRVITAFRVPGAPSGEEALAIDAARTAFRTSRGQNGTLSEGTIEHGGLRSHLTMLWFSPALGVSLLASVRRAPGPTLFGPFHRMTAEKLVPVLERYLRLWWLHRTERRRADAFSSALDLSDVGVALLNRRAELIFTNSTADKLLARGCEAAVGSRFITAATAADTLRIQTAIQHAVIANQHGATSEGRRGRAPMLAIGRGTGQRPLILTFLAVPRAAVDPEDPAAIVYLLDPQMDVAHLLTPACRLYRLTDAERRLVVHLVGGMTLLDAAGHMRVAPGTARSYLKQVFDKTATKRQTDLVRLMLSSLVRTNAGVDLSVL